MISPKPSYYQNRKLIYSAGLTVVFFLNIMLNALIFFCNLLPESIFSTLLNADFSRSDSPVFATKVRIHPTRDIKVCMPPRIWKKFFLSSGLYNVIWVAVLNNC